MEEVWRNGAFGEVYRRKMEVTGVRCMGSEVVGMLTCVNKTYKKNRYFKTL